MCLLYSEVQYSIRLGNHRITIAGGTPFRRDQPLEQLSGDRSDLFTAQNAEFSRKFTYAPPIPAYSNVCIEMVPVPWRIYAKLTDGTGNGSKTAYNLALRITQSFAGDRKIVDKIKVQERT